MIKSKVADMKNTGGRRYGRGDRRRRSSSSSSSADVPWVHLDIAGPAWADNESAAQDAGGTGCLVRTIVELAATYS